MAEEEGAPRPDAAAGAGAAPRGPDVVADTARVPACRPAGAATPDGAAVQAGPVPATVVRGPVATGSVPAVADGLGRAGLGPSRLGHRGLGPTGMGFPRLGTTGLGWLLGRRQSRLVGLEQWLVGLEQRLVGLEQWLVGPGRRRVGGLAGLVDDRRVMDIGAGRHVVGRRHVGNAGLGRGAVGELCFRRQCERNVRMGDGWGNGVPGTVQRGVVTGELLVLLHQPGRVFSPCSAVRERVDPGDSPGAIGRRHAAAGGADAFGAGAGRARSPVHDAGAMSPWS